MCCLPAAPSPRTKTCSAPICVMTAAVRRLEHRSLSVLSLVHARRTVTARLEHEYEHLTRVQSAATSTECGYEGLSIRQDAYTLQVPLFLRFGIGSCEEYNSATVKTLPRGPPSPFLDTRSSAFCATGTAGTIQAWLGFVSVVVLVCASVWREPIRSSNPRVAEARPATYRLQSGQCAGRFSHEEETPTNRG